MHSYAATRRALLSESNLVMGDLVIKAELNCVTFESNARKVYRQGES